MEMHEITKDPSMHSRILALRQVVCYNELQGVSEVLSIARNNIENGRKRKEVQKRIYLADLSDVVNGLKYDSFNSLREIKEKISSRLEQEMSYVNLDDTSFDKILIEDDLYVYGIQNIDESDDAYQRRLCVLDNAEQAIAVIEEYSMTDTYEVELAKLKKKYNKE